MLEKNQILTLTAEDLTNEGSAVCRTDGMVVFVPGMLPGECARVKIVKTAKNYSFGRMEELISPSPRRVAPACSVYPRCGGCTLLHLDYPGQLEMKRNHVANCLRKFSGTELIPEEVVASPSPLAYRNKVSMPVSFEKELSIGCFAARSHRVIDAPHCLLAEDIFSEIIAELRLFLQKYHISVYQERSQKGLLRHVILRTVQDGSILLGLVINGRRFPHTRELTELFPKKFPRIRTIVINENTTPGNVILGRNTTPVYENGKLRETLLGLSFDISLNTFLQINHDQTEQLYTYVLSLLEDAPEAVGADLYCGAGTITLNAARKCRKIYGIEIVPPAIADAKENARINGIKNAEFLCADCAEGFAKILEKEQQLDFVIVDPPRKGLVPSVIEDIARSGAPKVIYVSCDPATLSRDIALFTAQGYTPLSAQPFDMFPQSGHVETVVKLVRKKPDAYIDITVDMDELDLTASEAKATYQQIKDYIFEKHNVKVSSLYIAQVKQKYGIIERENYNKPTDENAKQPKCPPEKELLIEEALRHFKMIS